jgi:dihydroorotate dehydrogenase electron transfer subunit
VSIPQAGTRRGTFVGRVIVHESLCREHGLLTVGLEGFPPSRPGQFVQVQCRSLAEPIGAREVEWTAEHPPRFSQSELLDNEPLLRRPFSLAGRRDTESGGELDIIYRVVGTGTRWLTGLAVGDEVSILGPLGNAFEISGVKPVAALVGGGVGIPPMIYLAEALRAAGKDIYVFVGAQTADLLPLRAAAAEAPPDEPAPRLAEFSDFGTRDVVATDDGSLGVKGLVTGPLEAWLNRIEFMPDDLAIYTCGPEAMMRSVAELSARRGLACQVSMERSMGCGMGTCQSCVCKTRSPDETGWAYKLCCTDGPVFQAEQIIWS